MINREKVAQFLDVMDQLTEESADFKIDQDGKFELVVYPQGWWSGKFWSEEKRHRLLALITPLIGKLEKVVDGRNIGYRGNNETTSIRLSYIDQCKILGYRTVTKTVRKEVEREPEYEEVEEETRVAITDCDIRAGKATEDQIEIRA